MSPEDNKPVEKMDAPDGIEIRPKPPRTVHISRRAGLAIGVVVLLILGAFAYGGYKRQQRNETVAKQAGVPKAIAPATMAAKEIIQSMPDQRPAGGTPQPAAPAQPGQIQATNQVQAAPGCQNSQYRYDPETGRPCSAPIERVVVRQAPRSQPPRVAPQPTQPRPSPEEQLIAARMEREHEARIAPTGIRSASASSTPSQGRSIAQAPSPAAFPSVGAPLIRRAAFRSTPPADEDQDEQTRKEQWIDDAREKKTADYLASTRTAPLGAYEIKAGWEIPAVLEQGLNSDLPGELKALVTSNVYDTATGRFLLIPQGARLTGRYDSRVSYGQDGVQVVWNRIIYPDASSVDIDGMVGLDSHGNAGLRHKVDKHYLRLFGFSALTSAFGAALAVSQRSQYGSGGYMYPSASEMASAAAIREMSQTGTMITRRNLNVQPTIKVPAGYRFTVRVNRDILFEAPYEPLEPDPQPIGRELRRR